MDDREIEKMFTQAPGEPPPSTFSKADVVAASRRTQVRHRSMIAAACGCVVLALAGAGVFVLAPILNPNGRPNADSATVAPVSAQSGAPGRPGDAPGPSPNAGGNDSSRSLSPPQGGAESGKNGPRAESASGCGVVDRELATALAGELPASVTAAEALPGRVCTTGSRSAGFLVEGGTISVTLSPGGVNAPLPQQPPGIVTIERQTPGGSAFVLFSAPADGYPAAPLAGDVRRIADKVAARF